MGPGVLFNFIFKALTQRKHPSIRVVHKGTVAQAKAKAKEDGLVDYVSTNDIITSFFLGEMDAGQMVRAGTPLHPRAPRRH